MKHVLVRPENVQNETSKKRMELIDRANQLVGEYIRGTSFDRDTIVKEVSKETGLDERTVNWMML